MINQVYFLGHTTMSKIYQYIVASKNKQFQYNVDCPWLNVLVMSSLELSTFSTEYIFDNDLCKYHRIHTPTATNSKIAKQLPMNTSQHPLHIL